MDADAILKEIARLATLDTLSYELERKAAADRLGLRASALDEMVEEQRPKQNAGTGRAVVIDDVKQWDERVGGGKLLDELVEAIRRHVILSTETADAIALWIAHTWVSEHFEHTPRLAISSPAKRCGKSTLVDVLRVTCRRVLKADNISASGVFRMVEALAPITLLLDEADAFLRDNEELRGVLNSGFERSGQVVRVQEIDGEHQPIAFKTFAPAALAGIGNLPGTLEDRSVPVQMRRKGVGETAVKLRAPGARADLQQLARKLARWAHDRGPALVADPLIPEQMGDREGDICVALFSIADDAGNGWPERGRKALLTLFGRRAEAEGNMEAGALLLADLRELFTEKGATRLTSEQIVEKLGDMEERPWPEWKHGKPMTKQQLAYALSPFGIKPTTIRTYETIAKGYHRDHFEEAWQRYLDRDGETRDVSWKDVKPSF